MCGEGGGNAAAARVKTHQLCQHNVLAVGPVAEGSRDDKQDHNSEGGAYTTDPMGEEGGGKGVREDEMVPGAPQGTLRTAQLHGTGGELASRRGRVHCDYPHAHSHYPHAPRLKERLAASGTPSRASQNPTAAATARVSQDTMITINDAPYSCSFLLQTVGGGGGKGRGRGRKRARKCESSRASKGRERER